MDYYKETLNRIKELILEKKEDEARALIEEELKQVYIPREFEKEINRLLDEIGPKEFVVKRLSDEEIEAFLFDSKEKQLLAVDALNSKNLRDYIEIINQFLCSEGFINAKVLLVDSLIRQEIGADIKMTNEGMEYEFIPKYLLLPEESDGFLDGKKYLEDRYMKEPSKLKMAIDLLYKVTIMALPINKESEEGVIDAEKIENYIEELFK